MTVVRDEVAALDLRVRGGLAAADANLTDVREALMALYVVRGWRDLGIASWPEYLADAGATSVLIPPDAEQRRTLVVAMDGEGMTQQQIADELGVSRQQIAKDMRAIAIATSSNSDGPVSRKAARKADLDARIAAYVAEHPGTTATAASKAVGCSQSRVSSWGAQHGHEWPVKFGSSAGRALGAQARRGAHKPEPPPPPAPSAEPLWLRSTELADLRRLAGIVDGMRERNARIRIAQNITDATEAGDTAFVEQHARAAAEVAEYARELLAVFSDDEHRADLNRGIPGRTDHNYRPVLKIASA